MGFPIEEACTITLRRKRNVLPTDNPSMYISQKWTAKEIASFANAADTKKLKNIVDKMIKAEEAESGKADKNTYRVANVIAKSSESVCYLCKQQTFLMYYIVPENITIGLEKDSEACGGYYLSVFTGNVIDNIKRNLEQIQILQRVGCFLPGEFCYCRHQCN